MPIDGGMFMDFLQKLGFVRKQAIEVPPNENTQLVEDIREVCRQLDNTSTLFAMETDEDLLDAAIYQTKALRARYRYLLRQARERELEVTALPIEEEEKERWIN